MRRKYVFFAAIAARYDGGIVGRPPALIHRWILRFALMLAASCLMLCGFEYYGCLVFYFSRHLNVAEIGGFDAQPWQRPDLRLSEDELLRAQKI